jgi:hypothetical protein
VHFVIIVTKIRPWNCFAEAVMIFFVLQDKLSTTKVTANSSTDSDPVTGVYEDKLVDSKQLLDPIEYVTVKTEVTVSYSLLFPVSLLLFPFSVLFAIHFRNIFMFTFNQYKVI